MADLIAELEGVVKQMGFDLPQCYARDSAYNLIKNHHAEIAAAVRDAKAYRQIVAGIDAEQLVAASEKHGDALGVLKDAARYDWLKDMDNAAEIGVYGAIGRADLDAAIDTAMRAGEGEG